MNFGYEGTSGVDKKTIAPIAEELFSYIDEIKAAEEKGNYDFPESSVLLLSDRALFDEAARAVLGKKTKRLKYVFIIGIGGSSLGAEAFYDAECLFRDRFGGEGVRLFFIDGLEPERTARVEWLTETHIAAPEEFALVIISKSGTTMETTINAGRILSLFLKKFGADTALGRTVAITDRNSALAQAAAEKKIATLFIPSAVGGRYSVFSPAGTTPLFFADMDVKSFVESALYMKNVCLSKDTENNPALVFAATLYQLRMERRISIHDLFLFSESLEPLGKWHRQLFAESLGKGENASILPTVSIGTRDLHSVGQLYFGGRTDFFTTFVSFDDNISEILHADEVIDFGGAGAVSRRGEGEVRRAILAGIKETYRKSGKPFVKISLKNNAELGGFMQFSMLGIMFLARLFGVNAFDQPAVETYKETARHILESGGQS